MTAGTRNTADSTMHVVTTTAIHSSNRVIAPKANTTMAIPITE